MTKHSDNQCKLWALVICLAGVLNALAWQSDNGDGTFSNPPLYADYPDPDIIRVGKDFYMVSTTFVDSPGINVLQSKDLVNWKIVSHAASVVNGGNRFNMIGGTAYRQGFWAASIRYHNGIFYVVNNPTFGSARVYYTTNITGSWQYHELNRSAYDPGFFIDTDGTGYIVCGNTHLSLLTLNSNYSQVVSVKSDFLNYRGVEGSHMIKRGKYYYLFNANPETRPFALMCSRATNIFGPYETIKSLDDPKGGHQGGIVELTDGQWYGFVMKDSGAIGRMTDIGPIFWTNNWPVWGSPESPEKVPQAARKPIQGKPVCQPTTSDDFNSPTLGLQWQWNHNPDNSRWSLTERPGFLRLHPTQATNFWLARNTLTQKGQGPWSCGEVKLDLSHLRPGDICGFGTLGKISAHIAVVCNDAGNIFLKMEVGVDAQTNEVRVANERISMIGDVKDIFLRTDLDFVRNKGDCGYSLDQTNWKSLGGEFDLAFDWRTGTFQGEQFAIFCFNPQPDDGFVDVDWFKFTDDKKSKSSLQSPAQLGKNLNFKWIHILKSK